MPELAGNPYPTAGLAGYGSSSYIDAVILRDDEFDGGEWPEEADATLDRRVYYCQNWRADVVAILAANGRLIERAWYEPYGTPHGSSNGDFSGDTDPGEDHYLVPDGIVDGDDQTVFSTLFSAPDDLADMTGSSDSGDPDYGRPDGTIDASDLFFWLDCNAAADDLGRNVLSEGHTGASLGTFSVRNRKGLAGYEWDPAIRKYHVRNRVLDPDTGRWTRRDPLGYVDGMGVYGYVKSAPLRKRDAEGLASSSCPTCPGNGIPQLTSPRPIDPDPPVDPIESCLTSTTNFFDCLECVDALGLDRRSTQNGANRCYARFGPSGPLTLPPTLQPGNVPIDYGPVTYDGCFEASDSEASLCPKLRDSRSCEACCERVADSLASCIMNPWRNELDECDKEPRPQDRRECIRIANYGWQVAACRALLRYEKCLNDCGGPPLFNPNIKDRFPCKGVL